MIDFDNTYITLFAWKFKGLFINYFDFAGRGDSIYVFYENLLFASVQLRISLFNLNMVLVMMAFNGLSGCWRLQYGTGLSKVETPQNYNKKLATSNRLNFLRLHYHVTRTFRHFTVEKVDFCHFLPFKSPVQVNQPWGPKKSLIKSWL